MDIHFKVALYLLLFFPILSFGQGSATVENTFYNYLKEVSNTYDIQFAINLDAVAHIEIKDVSPAENKQLQFQQLKNILTNNNLTYLIVDDNKILIRENAEIEMVEETRTISGQIKSTESGENLGFASVFIPGTMHGIAADDTGQFSLEVPEKFWDKELQIQLLGYETKRLSLKDCAEKIEVELNYSTTELKTVYIVEAPPQMVFDQTNQSLVVHLSNLEKASSSEFFNAFNGNLITNFSSVLQSTNRAGIFVRGFQSNSMVLMDDIPVLRYDNYYSFLNNYNELYFDQIRIFKNASPTGWDQYAFGIIDLQSDAQQDRSILNLQTNLFYSGAELNLPIASNKWSVKIAGRKSYQDINKSSFNKDLRKDFLLDRSSGEKSWSLTQKPKVAFHDLNASIGFQDEKQEMKASFMQSHQDVQLASMSNRFFNQTELTIRETHEQNDKTNNLGFAWKYQRQFSPTIIGKLSFHHAESFKELNTEIKVERDRWIGGGTTSEQFLAKNRFDNSLKISEVKGGIEKKVGKSKFEVGTIFTNLKSEFEIEDLDELPFRANNENKYLGFFAENFTQWNPKLMTTISLGNFTKLSNGSNSWNTKLQVNYQLHDRFAIRGGYSYQNQFFNEANLENPFGQNYSLLAVADEKNSTCK